MWLLDEDDYDERINYSANYDIPSIDIEDYVPENLIRVYPYRAVYGTAQRPLVQPNTITYVRISNSQVDDFINLKEDENGKKYVEMFYAYTENTKITNSSGMASFEEELRKVKQFSVMTNNYFRQDTEKPDFFTLGKPFDAEYYRKGQQSVYYADNLRSVNVDVARDIQEEGYLLEDISRIATAELLDSTELTATASKGKIIFTEDISLGNAPLNNKGSAGFNLTINNGSLIHSVKANGTLAQTDALGQVVKSENYTEGIVTPLGLEVKNNFLSPVKMTPINIKDKLEMFSDWHDYDVVMPLGIASQLATEDGISIKEIVSPQSYASSKTINTFYNYGFELPLSSLPQNFAANNYALKKGESVSFNLIDISTPNVGTTKNFSDALKELSLNNLQKTGESKYDFKTFVGNDRNSVAYNFFTAYDARDKYSRIGTVELNTDTGMFKYTSTIDENRILGSYRRRSYNPATEKVEWEKIFLGLAKGKLTIELKISTKNTSGVLPFTNPEAMMLLEDLLILSAGFADKWTNIKKGADGKIDPNIRIGWQAWNLADLANQSPVDVLDGVFESYLRKYPSMAKTHADMKLLKQLICALSRYIYSSYSIGKGGNRFNEAYLPWFLESNSPIEYWANSHKLKVLEIDGIEKSSEKQLVERNIIFLSGVDFTKESETVYDKTNIKSFSTLKFTSKSQYFREGFSSNRSSSSDYKLTIPKTLNLSNLKMINIDRKITTTELDDTISAINKLPLPGDISTSTSDDLNYLFWTPTGDFKDIYINDLTKTVKVDAGSRFEVNLPSSNFGNDWNIDSIKAYVRSVSPNVIIGQWTPTKDANGKITNLDQSTIDDIENNYLKTYLSSINAQRQSVFGEYTATTDSNTYAQITGLPSWYSSTTGSSMIDPIGDGYFTGYNGGKEHFYGETFNGKRRFGAINFSGSGYWGRSWKANGTYSQLGNVDGDGYLVDNDVTTRLRNFLSPQLNGVDPKNIAFLGTDTWWTSIYGYATYVSHEWSIKYAIRTQQVTTPIAVTMSKEANVSAFEVEDINVIYDKNLWNDALWNFSNTYLPSDNISIPIDITSNSKVESINEIILTGIFVDKFQISFSGNPSTYSIDSNSRSDESLTTQRIIFY